MARTFGLFALGVTLVLAQHSPARAQEPAAPTLVFLAPADLPADSRSALSDALGTQLELMHVRLVLIDVPAASTPLPLEDRVSSSKAYASEHHALGVLWLDVRPTDHWFLYAMDADAERVVVRPLLVRQDSVPAAIEAVAVIARSCTEALLRGEPVSGDSPSVASAAPAAPAPVVAPAASKTSAATRVSEPPATSEHRLRLALAYRGETFASAERWQSGANLNAAWLWSTGRYIAVGFTWLPAHDFGSDVRFSVQQRPISLAGGFRFQLRKNLALDTELGATLDVRTRHTQDTPTNVARRADATRVLFALAPAVRLELAASSWLGLFAGASLDVFLNEFDYLDAPGQSPAALYPYRVRPGISAGLAILH